jgi:hypothetical protein
MKWKNAEGLSRCEYCLNVGYEAEEGDDCLGEGAEGFLPTRFRTYTGFIEISITAAAGL